MKNNIKKLFCLVTVLSITFSAMITAKALTEIDEEIAVNKQLYQAQAISADEDIYAQPNIISENEPEQINNATSQSEPLPQNNEQEQITPQNTTLDASPQTSQNENGIVLAIMLMMLSGLTIIRINSKS